MAAELSRTVFNTELVDEFIAFKRALGYAYHDQNGVCLKPLATALAGLDVVSVAASRPVLEAFTSRRAGESEKSRRNRATLARQFMVFLVGRGIDCDVPAAEQRGPSVERFTPRIITVEEMARIIDRADTRPVCTRMRTSSPIYSMMIRMLWSCGLRIGEAVSLRIRDVDLDTGCLTIRHAKNDRTRLVPMSASLTRYAIGYSQRLGLDWNNLEGYFFPCVRGGGYHRAAASHHIKVIMAEAGILKDGLATARVHDIRHSYAVAALAKMERDHTDIYAGLPLLATFMGHSDIKSTEYYLRLTRPEFASIAETMAPVYAGLFPDPEDD